jgi:Type II secretory pathway, component PulD
MLPSKTPTHLSLPLLPAFLLLAALAQCLHAGPGSQSPSFSGVEAQAELEIAKRLQLAEDYAPQAMQRGSVALMERDYETAYTQYKAAVDALPDAPNVRELRAVALDGFSKSVMGLAESRIEEGRWQDAAETVGVLLQPQYNPNYKPAQRLLARLESPDYFNKTVTPGFVARVEEVKTLLNEGQGLYDSGRFDEATAKYEAVLGVDRYNVAARRGMEQVNVARMRVADDAYNDTRSSMITMVDKAWETPVRRADLGPAAVIEQPVLFSRGTQSINRKLDELIVPRINFTDATVREAIEYLRQRSEILDTEAMDAANRGVNIVLKLDQAAASQTVTIDLANLPLREALTYITNLANLKFKVEPFAVLIVPINEATDTLITKEYRVPPGFITATPTGGGGGGRKAPGSGAPWAKAPRRIFSSHKACNSRPGPAPTSWPAAAGSSCAIRRKTWTWLTLWSKVPPARSPPKSRSNQSLSKFRKTTSRNLASTGYSGNSASGTPASSGVAGPAATNSTPSRRARGARPTILFFTRGSTVPVGVNPLTAGNRSGQTAITGNALDGLLFGSPVGPAAGVLALAGIFTNPQFQVVLRALNQKKGIDVLSAPRVTTKSGSSATVEVIREFRYPSEYEPPQIPQTTGSGTQPITPATPTSFEMKPIGVRLEVVPTVGPDNYTIDLQLVPEVTEFEGFINYGSPILNRGIVVTENVINYPVFSERKVSTEVSIYDGQTVVLGGLMREDVQKVNDKTPLLGDIPLAGALFRSQSDQHIKRNLVIFVTAKLIDPAGQALAVEQFAAQDLNLEEVPMPIDTVSASLEPPLPK